MYDLLSFVYQLNKIKNDLKLENQYGIACLPNCLCVQFHPKIITCCFLALAYLYLLLHSCRKNTFHTNFLSIIQLSFNLPIIFSKMRIIHNSFFTWCSKILWDVSLVVEYFSATGYAVCLWTTIPNMSDLCCIHVCLAI